MSFNISTISGLMYTHRITDNKEIEQTSFLIRIFNFFIIK